MNARNFFFPKVWMTGSLGLLAVFLVLFLKKTYDDEKANLAKEVGYVFMGAVRQIEGGALEKLVERQVILCDSMPIPANLRPKKDSIQVMTFIGKTENEAHFQQKKGDKLEIRVEHRAEKKGIADLSGSISMVVKLGEKPGDSSNVLFQNGDFLPQLQANFDSAMTVAGLSVAHKILRSSDTVDLAKNLPTGSYTDLASGERFSAQIADYQWFVLKKMIPNILFSLLVFGFVAFAFFSIWRNLAAQKRLVLLKNDLLQNIGHELKTPVSTVGVALEALRGFDVLRDPKRTDEYLEISKNELARLSLLVEKVLGLAQFESNAMPVRMAVFDFKKMVEDVLAAMRLQFEKHGAALYFAASDGMFSTTGDALHLSGVVFNLLDNALKYSTLRPDIYVKLSKTSHQILLEITDNGPGIPPEFQQKIFEKFFRIPTGARHDVKGHGLGLSYAAEVVRLHGGQILAVGSSFFVKING